MKMKCLESRKHSGATQGSFPDHMKYFEEMKFKDIAEVMDVSVGSLKAQYHHAVKKIEKFIKED